MATDLELGVIFKGKVDDALKKSIDEFITKIENVGKAAGTTNANLNQIGSNSSKNVQLAATQINALAASILKLAEGLKGIDLKGVGAMKRLGEETKKTKSSFDSFLMRIGEFFLVWRGMWAIFGFFQRGIEAAHAFSVEMGQTAGVVMATADELDHLKDVAYKVSKETGMNLAEVAKGMRVLAQAGLNAKEVGESMMEISRLARASGSTFDESSNLVTTAMRVWGIEAENVARITNVMAGAANYSKTTIGGLSVAFSYLAPTAAQAGYTMEQTAAMIAVMANAGIRMSTIGTGLSTMFTAIIKGGGKLGIELDRIGLKVEDLKEKSGKLKPLNEILQTLAKSGVGLETVFGGLDQRAARSLITAINQTSQAFTLMEQRLKYSTALGVMFARSVEPGLVKLQLIFNSAQVSLIKLADSWSNTVLQIGKAAVAVTTSLSPLIISVLVAVKILPLLAAGITKVTASFILLNIVSKSGSFLGAIGSIGSALAWLLTPVGAISAALIALGGYFTYTIATMNWFAKSAAESMQVLAEQEGVIIRTSDAVGALKMQLAALAQDDERNFEYKKFADSIEEVNKQLEDAGSNAVITAKDFEGLTKQTDSLIGEIDKLWESLRKKQLGVLDVGKYVQEQQKALELQRTLFKQEKKLALDNWSTQLSIWMRKKILNKDEQSILKEISKNQFKISDEAKEILKPLEAQVIFYKDQAEKLKQVVSQDEMRLKMNQWINDSLMEQEGYLNPEKMQVLSSLLTEVLRKIYAIKEQDKKQEEAKPVTARPDLVAANDAEIALLRIEAKWEALTAKEIYRLKDAMNLENMRHKNKMAAIEAETQEQIAGKTPAQAADIQDSKRVKIEQESKRHTKELAKLQETGVKWTRSLTEAQIDLSDAQSRLSTARKGETDRVTELQNEYNNLNEKIQRHSIIIQKYNDNVKKGALISKQDYDDVTTAVNNVSTSLERQSKIRAEIVEADIEGNKQVHAAYDAYIKEKLVLADMELNSGKYSKSQIIDQKLAVADLKAEYIALQITVAQFYIDNAERLRINATEVGKLKEKIVDLKGQLGNVARDVGDTADYWAKTWKGLGSSVIDTVSNKLGDITNTTKTVKDAFLEMGNSIRSEIMRVIARTLVLNALFGTIGMTDRGKRFLENTLGLESPLKRRKTSDLEQVQKNANAVPISEESIAKLKESLKIPEIEINSETLKVNTAALAELTTAVTNNTIELDRQIAAGSRKAEVPAVSKVEKKAGEAPTTTTTTTTQTTGEQPKRPSGASRSFETTTTSIGKEGGVVEQATGMPTTTSTSIPILATGPITMTQMPSTVPTTIPSVSTTVPSTSTTSIPATTSIVEPVGTKEKDVLWNRTTTVPSDIDKAKQAANEVSASVGNSMMLMQDMQSESNMVAKMVMDMPRMIKLMQDMMLSATGSFGGITSAFSSIAGWFSEGGKVRGYAGGGRILGGLGGRKDNILGRFNEDEFIVKKSGTKIVGDALLNKINKGDKSVVSGLFGDKADSIQGVGTRQAQPTSNYFMISATDAKSFAQLLSTRSAQEMIAQGVLSKLSHNAPLRRAIKKG